MTTAYFSAVVPARVDDIWTVARDFGNYGLFTSGRGETFIEGDRTGDSVGAIRNATLDGRTIRQRLLSHSDVDQKYQYEFCDKAPFDIENYFATLQFKPVIETGETFVEWKADFECELIERDSMRAQLESLFEIWIHSLKEAVISQN